jgi:acetylglutamate kinase
MNIHLLLAHLLSILVLSSAYRNNWPVKAKFFKVHALASSSESFDPNLLTRVQKSTSTGSIVVIKYGGHAMENAELAKYFCQDIASLCRLGILPVIVHGGGPQIAKTLKSLEIESKFVNGLRVTDPKTMEVAQMVLCGTINKDIVGMISSQAGIRGAVGLCGLDARLIEAKQKDITLGLVGEPTKINTELIRDILRLKLVPVIAPIGANEVDGGSLNINADTAAGAVAEALKVLLYFFFCFNSVILIVNLIELYLFQRPIDCSY